MIARASALARCVSKSSEGPAESLPGPVNGQRWKSHAYGMGMGNDTSPQTVMCTVGRNSHEKAANHGEIR